MPNRRTYPKDYSPALIAACEMYGELFSPKTLKEPFWSIQERESRSNVYVVLIRAHIIRTAPMSAFLR